MNETLMYDVFEKKLMVKLKTILPIFFSYKIEHIITVHFFVFVWIR